MKKVHDFAANLPENKFLTPSLGSGIQTELRALRVEVGSEVHVNITGESLSIKAYQSS